MLATILWIFITSVSNAQIPAPPLKGQRLDVEKIKEKYWTQAQDLEPRVIQHRLYSKENRFELGVFAGKEIMDPFLSVKNYGGQLGYHLSEFFAVRVIGWKNFVSDSQALTMLKRDIGTSTNSNAPKSFLGGELEFSPLYGKLSVLGKSIIYYDLHLMLGLGRTVTENGNYLTPFIGIGQQVYLSRYFAIQLDYRLLRYREEILQKRVSAELGRSLGFQNTYTDVIILGLRVFI